MIEVFKTNVNDMALANMLIERIHYTFVDYAANFDLEDCDNILRVESRSELIQSSIIIDFLKPFGCNAEVLPDNIDLIEK
jgi:hypothetical protein